MPRIGFDVGGTFTDFVLQNDDGRLVTAKRLTTYPDPSQACLKGLDELLDASDVSWAAVAQAVHGTTLGSNLVIERKGVGVGLVTTQGFRDVLLIGRQKRYQIYNLQIDKPEPLIDRAMTFEISERILANGDVRTPLDEDEARALIARLRGKQITSLAVSFLHSYANPAHERRFAELVAEEAPEIVVSLSSDVSPRFREYERTSTTVVNAYLIRAVRDYLQMMSSELTERGYEHSLFIMQSGGGAATAKSMEDHPVRIIESGPAAGALIAARIGELAGHTDLVAFDMGGTTAKLSLITEGRPATIDSFELHRVNLVPGSGIPMNVEALDLVEIGAGGGSIARVEMGTIRVGPRSAGSSPGPACYGLGGSLPTVTDANLVLGYLNPENFAGGAIQLDVEAARNAIQRDIARPLGLSIEEAAWGIHRIVNLNMELATRVVSIERGHDPRQLAFVATGGAGPAHGVRLAASLGMSSVIVPAASGVASALGLLAAQVRFATSRTAIVRLDEVVYDDLNEMLAELREEAVCVVKQSTGSPPTRVDREAEIRYVGQGYAVKTRIPDGPIDAKALATLRRTFEVAYQSRYGYASSAERAEATTWKVTAYGHEPTLALPKLPEAREVERDPKSQREAYFPEQDGFVNTDIFRRELLIPGDRIDGPAVVEERDSTTVIPPGSVARVDEYGSLVVRTS